MQRFFSIIAVCAALAVVAGCISYQQNTKFEADGSGTLTIDTWMFYFDDEPTGGQGTDPEAEAPTTAADSLTGDLGAPFEGVEGVTIEDQWEKVEGEGDERQTHSHLVLSFDKIGTLNGTGAFENQEMSFEEKDGKYVFLQTIINEHEEDPKEVTPESKELARALFEGYTFTYSVEMPGKITETNGTVGEDGRTVTWEWPLYDFASAEKTVMSATAER
ncbi:MAG: hypothetical protein PVH29_07800 [Candidatus Zixiibacteriota bacterium]|jgi:hypothetical protein